MTTNPIPYLTAYLAHARQKGCSKLIAVLEELIEETKKATSYQFPFLPSEPPKGKVLESESDRTFVPLPKDYVKFIKIRK